MSFESDLLAALKAATPVVWELIAPAGTVAPYITWQIIGGQSLRNLDKTASNKRNFLVQVNSWSKTRTEARTIIRAAEDALCAASGFSAMPEGEPISTYEDDTAIFGAIQRFSINATR